MIYVKPNNFFKYDYVYSKLLVIFYKLLHIVYGFDQGFVTHKSFKIKCFLKSICFIQCLAYTVMPLKKYYEIMNEMQILWFACCFFQFFSYGIIFIFTPANATLCHFRKEMHQIDVRLKSSASAEYVDKREFFGLFSVFCYRICMIAIFCFYYHVCIVASALSATLYFVCLLGLDFIIVTISFIYYSINHRLYVFISKFNCNNVNIAVYHHIYKSIADVSDIIKSAYDPVYLVALLCNIPEAMLSIYTMVFEISLTGRDAILPVLLRAGSIKVVVSLTLALAPAFCAGGLSSKAKRIEVILHDKLLQEKDVIKCYNLERFIKYVEARPLKFTVYKVIPLDAKLLGIVLNFCVTYLIVMVQFTHLY